MIYRKHDKNGDMIFGGGAQSYYQNNANAVAQAVKTRLLLFSGEWFLDQEDGTSWYPGILGKANKTAIDYIIRDRILNTPGVTGINQYKSSIDRRTATVECEINTIYGVADISERF